MTRDAVVGSWIKLPSPMSVEVVFAAGADFVCMDMCNGWLSVERVNDLLAHRGAPGRRLVRLAADASPSTVGQVLDAGADGVVIPHLDAVEHAAQMVAGALFAPAGTRGMGSTGRSGKWGLGPMSDYLAGGLPANGLPVGGQDSRPSITLMIESVDAVDRVGELAAITGVTQLLVGTADLAAALGRDPAAMRSATDDVLRACAKHSRSAAVATGTSADGAQYLRRGFDTLFLSNDLTLLGRSAAENFRAVRAAAQPAPQ